MVKDFSLVVSDDFVARPKRSWNRNTHYRELILKAFNPVKNRETKLNDVLTQLPCGIVFKKETGMGATTLELESKRNSIIVEPIKITAYSKASQNENYLYVGSPAGISKSKIEDRAIHNYLVNTIIKFKKIIVVADSLWRVIRAIRRIEHEKSNDNLLEQLKNVSYFNNEGVRVKLDLSMKDKRGFSLSDVSVLNNYFLFIDEIDSFQLDSFYRKSMEQCLDYYKLFDKRNRCMLSATDIAFSDPELQDEPLTWIMYNVSPRRKIKIIVSTANQLKGKVYARIMETLKAYPDDKIMVAYNSVEGCYNIAENLKRNKILKKDEIKILCSTQSKDRVHDYFGEVESEELPGKLNFITAAYFTGFDLKEKIHLISITSNRSSTQMLSEKRLKQIAGRCRPGLLSETIIQDLIAKSTASQIKDENSTNLSINKESIKLNPSKEDLIAVASEQVRSLQCMNKHYRRNKMLNNILEDLNLKFMRLLDEKQMRFIREDIKNEFQISYLNIDAKIESLRVKKDLYSENKALVNKLNEECDVSVVIESLDFKDLEPSSSNNIKDLNILETVEKLQNISSVEELEQFSEKEDFNIIGKVIVRDYSKLYGYFEPANILDKMKIALVGKRDSRIYNSLLFSAEIQTLPEGHIIVARLKYYFEIGQKYHPLDIMVRINLFLLETGNSKQVSSSAEAVKMLEKFCLTYRKKDKLDGRIYRHIKNYNPQDLVCIKKREKIEETELKSFRLLGFA